jgi:hypothetical protein
MERIPFGCPTDWFLKCRQNLHPLQLQPSNPSVGRLPPGLLKALREPEQGQKLMIGLATRCRLHPVPYRQMCNNFRHGKFKPSIRQ